MVLQSMKIAMTFWLLLVGCWADELEMMSFGGCAIGFGSEKAGTDSGES
jgi:hypothetical protein